MGKRGPKPGAPKVRCIVRVPLSPCYQLLTAHVERQRRQSAHPDRHLSVGRTLTEITHHQLSAISDPAAYDVSDFATRHLIDRANVDGQTASPQITLYLLPEDAARLDAIAAATGRWRSTIVSGLLIDWLVTQGLLAS